MKFNNDHIDYQGTSISYDNLILKLNDFADDNLKKDFYQAICYDNEALDRKKEVLRKIVFDPIKNNISIDDTYLNVIFGRTCSYSGTMSVSDQFYLFFNLFKKDIIRFLIKNLKQIKNEESYNIFKRILSLNNFSTYEKISRYRSEYVEKTYESRDWIISEAVNVSSVKYKLLINNKVNIPLSRLPLFIFEIGNFLGYEENIISSLIFVAFSNKTEREYRLASEKLDWSQKFIEETVTEKYLKVKNLLVDQLSTEQPNKKISFKQTHTATEMANFTFCAASYVLDRVYDFPLKENFNLLIGEEFHKKKYLSNFVKEFRSTKQINQVITRNHKYSEDFKRIFYSTLIYNSAEDEFTIHFSKNKKISARPDYIFTDLNSINFAVEEKFTFRDQVANEQLYDSHKTQALAYLYGLDSFNFSNVYVLYWHLQKYENKITIVGVDMFNIVRNNENKSSIIHTFMELEKLNSQASIPFPKEKINFRKCFKCDLFRYCDYKKGNFGLLKIA